MRDAGAALSARDIARRIQFMTGLVRKAVRWQKSGEIMRAARDAGAALRDAPADAQGDAPEAPESPKSPKLPESSKPSGAAQGRSKPRASKESGAPGGTDTARNADGGGKEAKPGQEPGWWVLAQGRILDPDDFGSRELARQDLLDCVLKAGVLPAENVWVWDETGRAQLVLATLPTHERAQRVAERLRAKGLAVAVRREMP